MERAVGYLTEAFLRYYFLLESICRNYISREEKWEAYQKLADVFCIEIDDAAKSYFRESEKKPFREIKDTDSYERMCRVLEFAEKSGQNVELTALDYLILSQKCAAVNIKSEIFKQAKNLTKETIASTLLDRAMSGNVDAMVLLAFMEYHGICITKDTYHALKRIRLCAKWNHTFGNLMGISYDPANTKSYYNILFTVFRNENQKEIFNFICDTKHYTEQPEKDAVAKIIEKAFGLDVIKRNMYDQTFSKVAFSQLISTEDKEKVLLSKQTDMLQLLAGIPVDAKKEPKIDFDADCAKTVDVARPNELDAILKNLTVTSRCTAKAYKPLCIISCDDYMTEMYANMLKAGVGQSRCFSVDAATLTARDLLPDRDNLFLRALSVTKTTQTVFAFYHCSDMEEDILKELLKMTDYQYRRHYKLSCPAISMDLSDIKFVFFSETTIPELCRACDAVQSRKISQAEKKTVAKTLLDDRLCEYGVKGLTMEDSCYEYIAGFDVGRIRSMIDEAIRDAVYQEAESVTIDQIKAVCTRQSTKTTEREFGYIGGVQNA